MVEYSGMGKFQKYVLWGQISAGVLLFLLVSRRSLNAQTRSEVVRKHVSGMDVIAQTHKAAYTFDISLQKFEALVLSAFKPSAIEYEKKVFTTPDRVAEEFSFQVPKMGGNLQDYISNKLRSGVLFEKEFTTIILCLLQQCREKNVSKNHCMFVDVGANIGSISIPVAARKFKVFAFEANRDNVGTLTYSKNTNINKNVKEYFNIYPFAAGNETRIAYLDSAPSNVLNTRVVDSHEHTSEDVLMGSTLMGRVENLLPLQTRIYGLKIDTEGYEYMVLQGMTKIVDDPYLKFIFLEIFFAKYLKNKAIGYARDYVKTKALGEFLYEKGFSCIKAVKMNCLELKPHSDRSVHMNLFIEPPIKEAICMRRS